MGAPKWLFLGRKHLRAGGRVWTPRGPALCVQARLPLVPIHLFMIFSYSASSHFFHPDLSFADPTERLVSEIRHDGANLVTGIALDKSMPRCLPCSDVKRGLVGRPVAWLGKAIIYAYTSAMDFPGVQFHSIFDSGCPMAQGPPDHAGGRGVLA